MRSIALVNQKGGVGKTTTVANLGACLAIKGFRTLLVDLDPQANLTIHLGIYPGEISNSAYEFLLEKAPYEDVIKETKTSNLNIIPSHIDLAGAEMELASRVGREQILKNLLKGVNKLYDFILVDCPPYLGLLTINALTAVKEVIIPVQTEYLALQGLAKLMETIEEVRKHTNKSLTISGILPVLYDSHTRLSKEVMEMMRKNMKKKVFKTVISKNVPLAESPSYGKTIFQHNPKSTGAENYRNLAGEVLDRGKKKGVRR